MKVLITGLGGFIGGSIQAMANSLPSYIDFHYLTSKEIDDPNIYLYSAIGNTSYKFEEKLSQNFVCIVLVGAFTPKEGLEANLRQECTSNIYFLSELLDFFENIPPKKIIYLSTIDVYGSYDEMIIDESYKCFPSTLYAQSKLYCESMIQSYSKKKNISSIILRIGHVYGPGEEKYRKFLPELIRSMKNSETFSLTSSPDSQRSFIYIEDVAKAIIRAIIATEALPPIINIVGSQVISINDVITLCDSITQNKVKLDEAKIRSSDKTRSLFNNELMHNFLIKPDEETSIKEGLSKYLDEAGL